MPETSTIHPRRPGAPRSLHLVALLATAFCTLVSACATQRSSTQPRAEAPAAAQLPSAGAEADAASGTIAAEPAEGAGDRAARESPPANPLEPYGGRILGEPGEEWQVDDRGRSFYLVEIDREPYYKILDNGYVLLPPGAAYELAEATEETIVVRVIDPEIYESDEPRRTPQEGRAQQVADLAALEVETIDSLRLEPIGSMPRRGQWRQGFELVDMNGDGHLDIVHGPPRKGNGQPRIFLGDGEGGWTPWREVRFEGDPLDYGDVAVADFDGDGALDLALAIHLRGLVVLRGDGAGRFTQWGEGLPYWYPGSGRSLQSYSSRTVEAIDWNDDGRVDLLTLGEGPRLIRQPGQEAPEVSRGERGAILFLNEGDGRWRRYDQQGEERLLFGDGLAVGDFDGDGRKDFAVASNVSGATKVVKLGRADGGWEDVALPGIVRPGKYGAVHAADLDGDGRDEILFGFAATGAGEDWWTGVDLVELEDGEWRRVAVFAVPENRGAVTAIGSGDLDGDGVVDLVALTGAGDRWLLRGTGTKRFVREANDEMAPEEVGCRGYDVAVASLGDGESVLLMGFAGEPGSEALFSNVVERSCPSQGSLEAWRVTVPASN